MFRMILQMSAIVALYVVLTTLIWKNTQKHRPGMGGKVLIGVLYGICAVLSTHFGVDYEHMMLNVRDMGPLSAGLYFDPMAGIIAGLIGGIERYIAGTYWGIGSYTRVACSVSTCLAGFVSAAMHIFIFKRKKPSAIYAFFMGAVMEVFHMYVVFITHREDMDMAFYVVRMCAPPMILFTGVGMALSSTSLRVCAGEWKNPFRRLSAEEVPVSHRFQTWLFAVTLSILALNMLFSFTMQTQSALQYADATLKAVSGDICQTYEKLKQNEENTIALAGDMARVNALGIAEAVTRMGGVETVDDAFMERMREVYGLVAVAAVDANGKAVAAAGQSPVYASQLSSVFRGEVESMVVNPGAARVVAGARCGDGMIQLVIDNDTLQDALNIAGLNEALSYYHVGSDGSFDLIRNSGIIVEGSHRGQTMEAAGLELIKTQPTEICFKATLFGTRAMCRTVRLDDGLTLLTMMSMTEVYADRDAQTYETALADIMLFAVIYVLISMLVQGIVVNNLDLVNASLDRITNGDLDEVVSVRNSSEFASLSNDINQTVNVLKGYIEAAEKRIEQELEFAYRIQDSALPKNFTFPRNDFELYATMDPAKEVGGDFYDFFLLGENRLALVIADVSGKGIPAALFMMRAKTAIRGMAETGNGPAEVLYRANNTLCEGNDAEMFVTVWRGIIDLTTGVMKCANAGHEYPVLMRAGGDYELFRDKHGLALAAMEGVRFKEYELTLNPGDRLFVYTDGIPEAIDGNVEQYGADRLVNVLNAVKGEHLRDVLPAVRKNIADFVNGADQFDDITMLGLAYYGPQEGEGEEGADA